VSQRASPIPRRDRRPVFEAFEQALACHAQGQLPQAEQLYKMVLEADERHFGAVHGLGLIRLQQGRFADAVPLFRRATKIDRNSAEAHHHFAVSLIGLGRAEEALERFEKALAIKPDFPEAHDSLGHALQVLGRFEQAILHHEKALTIRPNYAEARNNLGNVLQRLGRSEKALAQYEKALALQPRYAEAHNNIGRALATLGRHPEAIAHYESALAIRADYADAHLNLGNALWALGRHEHAIAQYDKALAIMPGNVETLNIRGLALQTLRRLDDAMADFEKALALEPDNPYASNGLASSAILACDWARTARLSQALNARVARGKLAINPFTFLGCCDDPALLLTCAKTFLRHEVPAPPPALWKGTLWRNEKIRIAYVASGFHQHSNAFLSAGLFELHDRSRFEIIGISLGPDDQSDMRARLVRAFDEFHDVRSKSDRDVAMLMNERRIDIAVDRSGYVTDARPGILAHQPAPIQVNYLGYPGTLGADYIDYVIADRIVLPSDQQAFFTEKIVYLPECYQANDTKRIVAAATPTRPQAGLPDDGFVFCCFNNNYKIAAPVFDIWVRLLHRIDGSVLWLLRDNAAAEENLRKEAANRGVDPARLVFAGRLKNDAHLARHRLADLFLDTLPYNAHTTASDALWMGVPVVTCRGESFAGRVAASLLEAAGLSELVTHSLEDYEQLALRLATDASLLRGLQERLKQNRPSCPLFDSDRYRRHLEAAYFEMWNLWQRGERPRSFAVEPLAIASPAADTRPGTDEH
jgi:protein O-GlcNAc transferase